MRYKLRKGITMLVLSAFLCINTVSNYSILAYATLEEYQQKAEERKSLPVQTNDIENWPEGPLLGAESAILMEANTGVILYAKNIDKKSYPASTTKLMTCLLAAEHIKLEDKITFSHEAVFSIERGSSNIGMDVGESITFEEALYGIMVGSANEVANAVGEHAAGSMDGFVDMMNAKAKEIGCKNTHFMNAHGLYDDNHYTSAYDLALIAKEFFQNELLSKIGNTHRYEFYATSTQPDEFMLTNKHKLITGEISYDGIQGGKTGYTDKSRQTLVTCAQKDGMKLICVIMNEESPEQFYDTVKLFDYGFNNFNVVNISENETRYIIDSPNFFQTGNDVFGSSQPILSIDTDDYLIMPRTVSFEDLESEISFETSFEGAAAEIRYEYHGAYIGTALINYAVDEKALYEFDHLMADQDETEEEESNAEKVIFINIKNVIITILVIAAVLIIFILIVAYIRSYSFSNRRRKRRRKRRKNRIKSQFDKYKF